MSGLKVYLIPGKGVSDEYIDIYNRTYHMWKKTWKSTMEDEWKEEHTPLFSDDFSRQDEIMSLFYNGECVACVFFKDTNFEEDSHFDDSYFKVWNDLSMRKLLKHGNKVLVCCNFTVSTEHRRSKEGIPWKDVLANLTLKRLIASDFDVMTGTMRRSKGMHSTTYKFGAVMVQENVDYKICGMNEPVDLVALYRLEVKDFSHPLIADLVDSAWRDIIALALPLMKRETVAFKKSA